MRDQNMLTDQERKVLNLLADAWNEYCKLDIQHPSHSDEFMTNIHHAQRVVMSRPTARDEGWIFGAKNDNI